MCSRQDKHGAPYRTPYRTGSRLYGTGRGSVRNGVWYDPARFPVHDIPYRSVPYLVLLYGIFWLIMVRRLVRELHATSKAEPRIPAVLTTCRAARECHFRFLFHKFISDNAHDYARLPLSCHVRFRSR